MVERCYLIDPGSDTLRLFDPKSGEVLRIRSCRLAHSPQIIGERAIQALWDNPADELVYPFFQGQIRQDPSPLLKAVFEKAPADRFWMIPKAAILSLDPDDLSEAEAWSRLLAPCKIASASLRNPFPVFKDRPLFHIHAGASQTLMSLSAPGSLLDIRPLDAAGIKIDEQIRNFAASKYQTLITLEDARVLKESASRAFVRGKNPVLNVTGMNKHGQFVSLSLRGSELWSCIEPVIRQIAREASSFICSRGPELMERLISEGIWLSGGMAECYGLAEYLEQYLHGKVHIPEEPGDWLLMQSVRKPFGF